MHRPDVPLKHLTLAVDAPSRYMTMLARVGPATHLGLLSNMPLLRAPIRMLLMGHMHAVLLLGWLAAATCGPRGWYLKHRSRIVLGSFIGQSLAVVLECMWDSHGLSASTVPEHVSVGALTLAQRLGQAWQGPSRRLQGRLSLSRAALLLCQVRT